MSVYLTVINAVRTDINLHSKFRLAQVNTLKKKKNNAYD